MATPAQLAQLKAEIGPEAYVRAMRHLCWEAGDLSYALHAGQLQAKAMVHRVHATAVARGGVKRAWFNIARRWGKTFFFVVYAIETMLRNPGARVPYAAMTETSVREFVEPIIRELAAHAPPHLALVEHKGEWVIPSKGSRLIVKGCEDRKKADRLRGPKAHAFIVDEAGFIGELRYVVQDVAAAQLSTTKGILIGGSNAPESPEHDFWHLADEAQSRDAYMHATVYDAPHLTPDMISSFAAEVGGEHTLAWQREGLSQRVVDVTKAVYPEWAEAELAEKREPGVVPPVIGERALPPYVSTYVVGDLGFADLTMILLAYYDFEAALLVVVDEVVTRRQTSDVIESRVRETYRAHFGDQKPLVRALEGDALVVAGIRKEERIARGEAQRGVAEDPEADDTSDTRWNQIAFVQMEAAVNAARLRIKRRGVLVHPRCATLIAHLRGAIWNEQRTDFVRIKGPEGHHFDGAAAFAYLVKRLRPEHNPIPAIPPGIDYRTHRIPAELTEAGRHAKLKRAFAQMKRDRR